MLFKKPIIGVCLLTMLVSQASQDYNRDKNEFLTLLARKEQAGFHFTLPQERIGRIGELTREGFLSLVVEQYVDKNDPNDVIIQCIDGVADRYLEGQRKRELKAPVEQEEKRKQWQEMVNQQTLRLQKEREQEVFMLEQEQKQLLEQLRLSKTTLALLKSQNKAKLRNKFPKTGSNNLTSNPTQSVMHHEDTKRALEASVEETPPQPRKKAKQAPKRVVQRKQNSNKIVRIPNQVHHKRVSNPPERFYIPTILNSRTPEILKRGEKNSTQRSEWSKKRKSHN